MFTSKAEFILIKIPNKLSKCILLKFNYEHIREFSIINMVMQWKISMYMIYGSNIYSVLIGMRCKGCDVRRVGHRGNGEGKVVLYVQNPNSIVNIQNRMLLSFSLKKNHSSRVDDVNTRQCYHHLNDQKDEIIMRVYLCKNGTTWSKITRCELLYMRISSYRRNKI